MFSQEVISAVADVAKQNFSGVNGKIIGCHWRVAMTHCLMVSRRITKELKVSLKLLRTNSVPRISEQFVFWTLKTTLLI